MDFIFSLYPYVQALRNSSSATQIPPRQVASCKKLLYRIQQISPATKSDIDMRWSKKFMPREFV